MLLSRPPSPLPKACLSRSHNSRCWRWCVTGSEQSMSHCSEGITSNELIPSDEVLDACFWQHIGHIKRPGDHKAEGPSGHKDHLREEGDVLERDLEVQQLRDQLARLKRQIIQSSAAAEDEKADIRRVCPFSAVFPACTC